MLACPEAARETSWDGPAADARKLSLAREFGAHHTIDVENEDAKRRVRELTDASARTWWWTCRVLDRAVADALDYVRRAAR